jgi:uncharacterized protein (DUF342 family)
MLNGELKHTEQKTPEFEYLIEPLPGEKTKLVLSSLENGILYSSKFTELTDSAQIIPKNTPLFKSLTNSAEFENIYYKDDKYISKIEGIFVIDNSNPTIIPVSKSGLVDINISDDKMTVTASFYPPLPGGKEILVTDVMAKLQSKAIKAGVNKNAILQSLALSNNRKQPALDVTIASGKLPVKGEDGKIECTINWKIDSKPSVNKNGKLDFHEIHSVIAVNKNQVVGKLLPPKHGQKGYDVFNNPIDAKTGDEFDISTSHNIYVSQKDNKTIHSKIDGFFEFKNNIINIKEEHVVSGDIDFHTGNISGNGSIKISGSVLNGFKLNLRDDIEIGANVGDAVVEAGGNILIKGGFSGTEHGKVKAGGDISVKYIENQSVFSNKSLTFTKDILHSKVYVSNSIKGNGGNPCIIGGYTIAGESVEVAQIGNEAGTKTIIELGYDYSIKEKIEANKQKVEEIVNLIKQMDQKIIDFSSMKRLNPQQVESLKTLAEQRKNYLTEIDTIKLTNAELKEKTFEPSSAYLRCTKKVYPGTTIIINGRKLEVKETLSCKTFQLSKEGEIVF